MSNDPLGYSPRWDDDVEADPLSDLQAWAVKIAADCGHRATRIFMSPRQYEEYIRYIKWREQTEMILASLPRRRFISRMVLKRQLHGPLHKRYRPRWWYRLREWNRERTGWYDDL